MNNEPVAYVDPNWMDRPDLVMSHQLEIGKLFARTQFKNYVPLYTHLVKEHFEDEPQAEELHEIMQSNAELTDEEIGDFEYQIIRACGLSTANSDINPIGLRQIIKDILRKAQE